jgi:hypothetical protein
MLNPDKRRLEEELARVVAERDALSARIYQLRRELKKDYRGGAVIVVGELKAFRSAPRFISVAQALGRGRSYKSFTSARGAPASLVYDASAPGRLPTSRGG